MQRGGFGECEEGSGDVREWVRATGRGEVGACFELFGWGEEGQWLFCLEVLRHGTVAGVENAESFFALMCAFFMGEWVGETVGWCF